MLNMLLDISSDPILSRHLVFKWGTALYFLYGLDRFSTDLDFDLLEGADTNEIRERLQLLGKKYGEVKDSRIQQYTIFTLVSYGDIDHNIKIEVSKRGVSGNYDYKNFLGIKLLLLDIADISANKFLALLSRPQIANRDIYDIHFILKNSLPLNEQRIEELSGISMREYAKKCREFLESLPATYSILDGLGEVIEGEKKQYLSENLVKETIFLLSSFD
jgi:predicted nucleotidyltransferase component of viral defense system